MATGCWPVVPGRLVVAAAAVIGRGEVAGLPEQDELFQPADEAREAGHDEGVQCRGQPIRCHVRGRAGAKAAEVVAQDGRVN